MASKEFLDITGLKTFWKNIVPHVVYYGVCPTHGYTQIKEVTIPGFQLVDGTRILVEFAEQNIIKGPSLRVSNGLVAGVAKTIFDVDGNYITEEQQGDIEGYCEFVYREDADNGNGGWILFNNRQKNIFYYSQTEPENKFVGLIWLKPNGSESGDTSSGRVVSNDSST